MTIGRVLVVPLGHQDGLCPAFQEIGMVARELDHTEYGRRGEAPDDALLEAVEEFAPDWIWLQLHDSKAIRIETILEIRRRRPACLVTHWMGDCRSEIPPYLASVCRATHGTLISSVGQVPLYLHAGAPRVAYCQIGVDPASDLEGKPSWTPPFRVPEVVFCGRHYEHIVDFRRGTAQRLDALRALTRAKFDVGVVGQGWPEEIRTVGSCQVKQQHHVYKRAKVVVAINHFNAIERYYSDRLLIAMASGTPVVGWRVPDIEHEFTDGVDLLLAGSSEDFVDRVRWLLAHPREAAAIGQAGHAKIAHAHTWAARLRQISPTIANWHADVADVDDNSLVLVDRQADVSRGATRVAVVFGTYNRLELLKRAVASIRTAVGSLNYKMFVVDGGSSDGTRDWLLCQPDVTPILQEGPLTGAVRAFNLGFAAAVDGGYDFVSHLNDDAEVVTPDAIAKACELLEADPQIGEVAFEFDLRGPWGFEYVDGKPYANFGVIRREAGMAVARAQGDPTGRAWWNPIYRTYAADTEFGVWLWKLGWRVHCAEGLRVHDVSAKDALRAHNEGENKDSALFWKRRKEEESNTTGGGQIASKAPAPISAAIPAQEKRAADREGDVRSARAVRTGGRRLTLDAGPVRVMGTVRSDTLRKPRGKTR